MERVSKPSPEQAMQVAQDREAHANPTNQAAFDQMRKRILNSERKLRAEITEVQPVDIRTVRIGW